MSERETDSDSDSSLEFYDAVLPPLPPTPSHDEISSSVQGREEPTTLQDLVITQDTNHVKDDDDNDNDKDDNDNDDNDDNETSDHFTSEHTCTSLSLASAERDRSRSTNDIIIPSNSPPAPTGRGTSTSKGGFTSSIRSLFGGMSNFDLDDLDAEESAGEEKHDSDEDKDKEDMVRISSSGIQEGKDTSGSDRNPLASSQPPNTSTPADTDKKKKQKKQTKQKKKEEGKGKQDGDDETTATPAQSLGSSIWNFVTLRGWGNSSSSSSRSGSSGSGSGNGNPDSPGSGGGEGGSDRERHKVAPEKKCGVKLSLLGKKQATYHDMSVMQELEMHHGPVWVMRFSRSGTFLASGGQDGRAVVWSVGKDRRESCLVDMDDEDDDDEPLPPSPSLFTLGTPSISSSGGNNNSSSSSGEGAGAGGAGAGAGGGSRGRARSETHRSTSGSFIFPIPCRVFSEHDGHIVDLSWSMNNFLVTACLDKIVRLWHVKSPDCLQQFKHTDLVSSLDFHPSDDRFFVTGCFDKVLRLWDTTKSAEPMKFKEAQDMITSVAFTPDGSRVAVGLFRGQVFFYKTEDLKIETQIVCTKSRKKRKIKYGYKVTGLVFRIINESEYRQNEGETEAYELLVTTNDSSIRLYQVKDLSLTTKFKGFVNKSKPIRASFSNHGHHIICGSDTTGVFIWKIPKRRHMESKREKNKRTHGDSDENEINNGEKNHGNGDGDGDGDGGDVKAGGNRDGEGVEKEKQEDGKYDQWRARFESFYYSKKYEIYKKCEKMICEDNFKHLCTTVAIFAPPAALREAATHLQHTSSSFPSSSPRRMEGGDGGERGGGGREQKQHQEEVERRKPFNTVIFDAEINGTIRIIRAKSSSPL